ncbi:MAG: hypothetical protein LBJ94_01030 [Puniceicoccales bacterium]|nr:hypothetical protein [Puniceicoccales bacterium]
MRKGSILVLVLGVVLVMGMLAVSFLRVVDNEISYIGQIDPYLDLRIRRDSVLSIVIANLYSHLTKDCSMEECREKIERCIGDNLGEGNHFFIAPEDNKIPLKPEFLNLLEQLFFALWLDYQDVISLIGELEELFRAKKLGPAKIEHLLTLPTFSRVFIDGNGFFTEKWQVFAKNITCQNADAVALHGIGDELLNAICALESWRPDDAKAVLKNTSFLSENSRNDVFTELYSRGCIVHNPGLFMEKNLCFSLSIATEMDGIKLAENYTVKYDPLRSWHGFPFEVVSQASKF